MNLFENILKKAKTWVNYLATGKAWSDLYDWANPEQQDPIQRFFDDPAQDMSKKQALMDNLKSWVPVDVMKSYVTEKYYKPVELKQTVPTVNPTFQYTGQESPAMWALKTIWNIPSNIYNIGATTANLASTAYQEGIPETAWMIARWAVKQAGQWAQNVATSYQNQWLIGATNTVLEWANKFLMENPLDVVWTPAVWSLAKQWVKTGAKSIVRWAEIVAPKVVQWVKNITPKLPKAEELLVTQLEKTNRMNPTKYMEFEQMAGQRAGKFLADRKITGDAESNVAKLYDNFTKSKSEADKWLDAIQKTYKTSEVPPAFNDMLGELEKRFTYTKDNANLAKVKEFKTKLENWTLSHNDINWTKRLYEQKVKVNYIKDQNSLEVERATNIDNDVRSWQFDEADKLGFSNLRDINKETQLNRYLADNIWDKIARQAGLNNISLTDWIIAGQVPATPQALALLAGKKFAQNVVPKLYQKWLEKVAKLPTKNAPVANIENISKMETIRKNVNPQYDSNRLLVSPRNSSRTPTTITPTVTLPTWEKWILTKKTPNIKSDITSKSKIVRPWTKPVKTPIIKPKNESKVSEPVVVPKKIVNTPIVKKKSNIRSTEWSNDFVSYFQKDLWDNITKEWLLKFGFTEKQILDNTFDFLKSKDNKLWVSLEDLFAIAKKQKKPLTTPSNAKQQVSKPISSDTIPEGYTKNSFGEVIKKPWYKKGGFVKIAPEPKKLIKSEIIKPTKTAKEFITKHYKGDNNPLFDELDKITMDSLWFKWSKRDLNNIQEAQFDMRRNAFKDEFEKIRKTEWVKTGTTPIFRKWEEPQFYNWNTEKVARERFDIQNLQKLWDWSDRDVYDLWNWKVLKVVKTARWLEQTSKWTDYLLQDAWITPEVYEQWRNYVVTEKIKQFKDMDKAERKIINDFIDDMQDIRPYWNRYPDMWKIQEWLEKYGWEDLANYDMQTFWWGDIRKANIGIKNWKPILIDEWTIDLTSTINSYKWVKNMNDPEFRSIYQASKDIKKKLWDIDANTMYNIAWFYIWWNILLKYLVWDDENENQ